MAKPQLQTIAPLGVIAATLLSLAVINLNKPKDLSLGEMPTAIQSSSNAANVEHIVDAKSFRLGKPGTEIDLLSTPSQSLALSEEKTFDLVLKTQLGKGMLHIYITTDAGIELTSEQVSWHFDLSKESDTLSLPVSVYANSNGQHYLNIFIEHTNEDGSNSSRALATEFNVGESLQKFSSISQKSSQLITDSIISLPSKETIY